MFMLTNLTFINDTNHTISLISLELWQCHHIKATLFAMPSFYVLNCVQLITHDLAHVNTCSVKTYFNANMEQMLYSVF